MSDDTRAYPVGRLSSGGRFKFVVSSDLREGETLKVIEGKIHRQTSQGAWYPYEPVSSTKFIDEKTDYSLPWFMRSASVDTHAERHDPEDGHGPKDG